MSEDYQDGTVPARDGVLDRADLDLAGQMRCHPNDEEASDALVEYEFRRDAAVGTTEDDGEGIGRRKSRCQPGGIGRSGDSAEEPGVALRQPLDTVAATAGRFRFRGLLRVRVRSRHLRLQATARS